MDKKDGLNAQHAIVYLKLIEGTAKTIKDPRDDIEAIFNKILKWKKTNIVKSKKNKWASGSYLLYNSLFFFFLIFSYFLFIFIYFLFFPEQPIYLTAKPH